MASTAWRRVSGFILGPRERVRPGPHPRPASFQCRWAFGSLGQPYRKGHTGRQAHLGALRCGEPGPVPGHLCWQVCTRQVCPLS